MTASEFVKTAFELKSKDCYKQAIEMLYKALEVENDNPEILFQIGELYYLLINFDRAVQYLEKVLAIDSKHADSMNLLRIIYEKQNDFGSALRYAKLLYETYPTPKNTAMILKNLSKLKMLDEIESLDLDLSDDDVLYEYAQALYENGQGEKALELFEKSDLQGDSLILKGKIYFDKNEFEKAKEIFESFGKNTDNAEVLNYLGMFALEEMRFIDAIKNFSKSTNIDKQNPVYLFNLGNAYFYNGWLDEAAKAYLGAVCLASDNMDYRYALAYLYYERKQFDKAQNEVDYILSIEDHVPTKVLNALLKFEKKDFLGAQKDLEQYAEDDFALTSLAKVYSELGMFEKAEQVISKIIEKNPENLSYLCDLAEIYIREKKFDAALEIVEKVLKINENFIAAYATGAKAAFELGDLNQAKEYSQSAISLDMNYPESYYYLALVRDKEEDFEEAIECMKRAITGDAANAKYYAKMSDIYKSTGDIKTALDYIKEAVSIDDSAEYKILYTELAGLKRKNGEK